MKIWAVGWVDNGAQKTRVFDSEAEAHRFAYKIPEGLQASIVIWRMDK